MSYQFILLFLETCRWGPWFNSDTNPSGQGDLELISEIVRIEGSKVIFSFIGVLCLEKCKNHLSYF